MATITLFDNPPKPVGGNGEIIVDAAGHSVILTYEEGKLVSVSPASDDDEMFDLKMTTTDAAAFCYKCLKQDGELISCWAVPC
jgi:hypothetical protein